MTNDTWLARLARWTWRALLRVGNVRRAGARTWTRTARIGQATLRLHGWSHGDAPDTGIDVGHLLGSAGLRALARIAEQGTVVGAHVMDADRDDRHVFVLARPSDR